MFHHTALSQKMVSSKIFITFLVIILTIQRVHSSIQEEESRHINVNVHCLMLNPAQSVFEKLERARPPTFGIVRESEANPPTCDDTNMRGRLLHLQHKGGKVCKRDKRQMEQQTLCQWSEGQSQICAFSPTHCVCFQQNQTISTGATTVCVGYIQEDRSTRLSRAHRVE